MKFPRPQQALVPYLLQFHRVPQLQHQLGQLLLPGLPHQQGQPLQQQPQLELQILAEELVEAILIVRTDTTVTVDFVETHLVQLIQIVTVGLQHQQQLVQAPQPQLKPPFHNLELTGQQLWEWALEYL